MNGDNMSNLKTDYVDCFCKDFEHVMRFVTYENEDDIYLSLEGNLSTTNNIWKRIKYAWKYLFLRKYDNTAFYGPEFELKEVKQIKNICDNYIKKHEKKYRIKKV